MKLVKCNGCRDKFVKINQIVHTIAETHRFDKNKLIAINTSDVENGVINGGTLTPVEELKGQFKKTIKKGDILFSEIRPANRRFAKVMIEDCSDFVVSTKLMVLRKYNENVDLEYFYYCLTNQSFLDILQRRAENRIGSFPQITFDLLSEYSFPIPSINEQKRIANVISSLDKKISINRQINQNLEALAKQLYDYWFVQFDFPDENGRPYKSSGGKMVWNEKLKRNIPKNWNVTNIGDILDKVTSTPRLCTDEYMALGKYPVIDQTTDVYYAGFTDRTDAVVSQYPAIVFGDHSCAVKYINFPFVRGADGTQVMLSNNPLISIEHLYFTVKDLRLRKGYTRHFSFLKDHPIIIPDRCVSQKFMCMVQSIFSLITNNREGILLLVRQRDELLPLLMNGQVSVNSDLSHD